jgi:hypothetical protein
MLDWVSDTGDGYGASYGAGYVLGYGNGYGDGFGYSYSEGDGDGLFNGHGNEGRGRVIGSVGKHEVRHLSPWPYVRVGCKVHHVDTWRDKWLEIAEEHGVEASKDDVDALLKKCGGSCD